MMDCWIVGFTLEKSTKILVFLAENHYLCNQEFLKTKYNMDDESRKAAAKAIPTINP